MTKFTSEEWNGIASAYDGSGLSLDEVSAEVGKGSAYVRTQLSERGVFLTPERFKTLRQHTLSMSDADANEFLLGVLEEISWINPEIEHPTDGIKVRPAPRRMLRAMFDAMGRALSRDHLITVSSVHARNPDDFPSHKTVDVMISHIRKSLRGSPWKIVAVRGFGYKLEPVEIPACSGAPAR